MTLRLSTIAAVRWIPLVVLMTTVTKCNGIRGAKRRRANVYMHENAIYNDAATWGVSVGNSSHEILHENGFPAQQDILDPVLVVGEEAPVQGEDEERQDSDEESNEESDSKRSKAPKRTKAIKARAQAKTARKKTKATSMPTVSSSPSSMPSISNQPSVSSAPSTAPSVSAQPTTSSSPSSVPTVSSMPSISAEPTSMPVAVAVAATEPPTPDIPDSAINPPVEKVEILNKFALRYLLRGDPTPSDSHYSELSTVTGWYIGNHSANYYFNMAEVFLEAKMTSYFEPAPFVLDYDVTHYFAQHAPVPTVAQSDQAIANAFTTEVDRYIDFLGSYLNSTNPFSNTVAVDYSTYWEALISQSTANASSGETQSDSTTKKIVAPIVAIAGVVLLLGGAFLVKRERSRRNDMNRVNDNRWDENGGNLNLDSKGGGSVEEHTVILDGPPSPSSSSSSGDHSYVPSSSLTADSPLSTVYEGDSNDGSAMGDSPSEVMREMNLSSALEDVDLESETGGIADLPGRHDRGGIGELTEKPVPRVETL